MSGAVAGPTRTSVHLFRDCLRLVNHIAGKSKKGQQLRKIVGGEFRKNAKEENEEKVGQLKSNAIRALANYLMIESSTKDARLQGKVTAYSNREASTLEQRGKKTET